MRKGLGIPSELLVESGAEVIVLYSEEEFYNELKNQSLENELITFIKLTDKRYLHPFLVLITNIKIGRASCRERV